jgi:phosphoglycolate phosphatase-like HAD superfamily hydrolase
MTKSIKTVLITDLDDTLWDWLNIWYSSFYPMFQEILRITGAPESEMTSVIKTIHEARGTSEYTFLLEDIERAYHRPAEFDVVCKKYESALHAFRSGRKRAQKLFPGVKETLHHIKGRGARVIGYTESQAYATIQRLKAFELDGVFDILYSPKDHDYPDGIDLAQVRSLEASNYKLQNTIHHHTPPGELKPNPGVLKSIISDARATSAACVYVGDKLVKDVMMARDAGVLDAWAKYGSKIHTAEYDFLKKVTHWSPNAVAQEAKTKAAMGPHALMRDEDVPVTITLNDGFADLLEHVTFQEFDV